VDTTETNRSFSSQQLFFLEFIMKSFKGSFRKQAGFTLLELTAVIAIIAILAIASLIALPPLVISGKVGPAATEMLRGMQKMKINSEGAGATPFTSASTSSFANLMRNGSTFTVTGTGAAATVDNSLRLLGSSAVAVAPATLTTLGDAYSITLSNVSDAACPQLAASAQRGAEVITINGTSVKPAGGQYNGAAAADACTLLDTNTFVFTAN
jgi:type IV pilus assembly protein PilA